MSRGYPQTYRASRSARGAVAVARTLPAAAGLGMPQISLRGIAAAVGGFPKVPAPHPALLLGVAAVVAIGYALRYFNEKGEEEDLGPLEGGTNPRISVTNNPATYSVNPAFTFISTSRRSDMDGPSTEPYSMGYSADEDSTGTSASGMFSQRSFGPTPTHFQIENPFSPKPWIAKNWYYGVTTEVRRRYYSPGNWYWYNAVDRYRNLTGATISPPMIETPGSEVTEVRRPPAYPQNFPISAPGATIEPYSGGSSRSAGVPGVINPDGSLVRPDKGIGTIVGKGTVAAMAPAPTEIKTRASAATMKVISQSLGRLGEGFDATRCFMFAFGNTYVTRSGVEKTIPKWQWRTAILDLAGQAPVKMSRGGGQFGRRSGFSEYVDGNIITADGRVMTGEDVGRRLIQCLVANEVEDFIIGQKSKLITSGGRAVGLTAGPLGAESLLGLIGGETPYEGLMSINIQ